MFDQLFVSPASLARHRDGPLPSERHLYLVHLASQGMARKTLRQVADFLLIITDYLSLDERPQAAFSHTEIDIQAQRWANRRPKPPRMKNTAWTKARFLYYATGWLRFLGRLQHSPTPPRPGAEEVLRAARN